MILDTRSTEVKRMLEFLKATRYAKVVEEKISNDETLLAIRDVENGKVNVYESVKEMISTLKKREGV